MRAGRRLAFLRLHWAVSFSDLGLGEPLLSALADLAYETPTAVQRAVIPEVLAGRDVWATASTGSGKTAAFVLPLLERFRMVGSRQRTLVLTPTRELALQIGEAIEAYGKNLPAQPRVVVVLGGVSINPQMMALRGGADLVIATPGRLLDLLDKNALSLGEVSTLVLDEADRLLDESFAVELDRIRTRLPREHQTLLFSATFGPAVQKIAEAVLREPAVIDVSASKAELPAIHHRAILVDKPRRTRLLAHLIQQNRWSGVLVFVATSHSTEHVAHKLRGLRIHAEGLSGELSQGARVDVLTRFRQQKIRVLVATDLASRGLDITGLPVVVQYDLPRSTADYLHRAGRTARAGEPGEAVAFVTAEGRAHFELVKKRHVLDVPLEIVAGFEPTEEELVPPTPADPNGGVKGRRKSKKDKLREAAARATKERG
jgi:ATP-dependent RNA helicase RhlE